MPSKVCSTLDEAVADIPSGASILVGGFGPGTPYNLIMALHRQGARDLVCVTNNPGYMRANDLSLLAKARRLRKVICAFTASPHPSRVMAFSELYEKGEVEGELVAQGTLAERIRAGGAGIPAFYTPSGVGTELAQGKEHRTFNGRTYLLEHAITADYAFVRAWKADTFGNLVFRLSQRNFNPIMAMAARCTIVEVEEPIVAAGRLDPDQIHVPGIYVHRIVRIPPPPEGVLDSPYNV
ncbi:MAG: CoA transferase subunit A [Chloroflexi bacterium]|nr:CoA transferase subunit A [Chloroflexota bacterium]